MSTEKYHEGHFRVVEKEIHASIFQLMAFDNLSFAFLAEVLSSLSTGGLFFLPTFFACSFWVKDHYGRFLEHHALIDVVVIFILIRRSLRKSLLGWRRLDAADDTNVETELWRQNDEHVNV